MRLPAAIAAVALLLVGQEAVAQGVPRAALAHRRALISNARAVWGLDAPVAVFAAQVHQESAWRPDARSKFADGMAQFTPATARWISERFPEELGSNEPFNPAWTLRALVRYDRYLWDLVDGADDCERWAMVLSAYNGGLGNLRRDVQLALSAGADGRRWFGHVEHHSRRARWAFEENRGYPRRILLELQPRYLGWGPGVDCGGVE